MRAVVQRVRSARVEVEGENVGEIGPGFMVLVGVRVDDQQADLEYIANKLVHLRVFEDDNGTMNLSILETDGAMLIVSQFTLFGDCRKGRRPSYIDAAKSDVAYPIYDALCERVAALGVPVERGRFGADMQVQLVNEGPVTILLDSSQQF